MVHSKFADALPYFPQKIRQPLQAIPKDTADQIQEIRLRIGQSVQAVKGGKAYALTWNGTLAPLQTSAIVVQKQDIDALFQNLCCHSVHSRETAIRQGFLTAAGGNRAGICGTAVMQHHKIETIRTVSSINFRIASERIGCAAALMQLDPFRKNMGGILIAGPPASGKTTLLRDLTRILSQTYRIALLDSRGELAAIQNGIPQFDLGMQTDILDAYPKAEGIEIAVRVKSPEILICDEIGDADEADALLQSVHTGVRIIATAHAGSIAELYERPQILRLIRAGVFHDAVLLGSGNACGQVLASQPLRGQI